VYLIPVVNGLAYGLLLFVVATGLTLAFGSGGVLNLAHGVLFAAGAYAAAVLTDGSWVRLGLAVLAGTAVAAALGAGLGLAVAPLAGRGHLAQALLTFGVALLVGAGLVLLFGADELRPAVPAALDQPVWLLGRRYPGYRLWFIAVAALLAVALWLVLARTRAGARVRAMAADREMLACCGTNPRLVLVGVLAAGGGLAGLAGVLGAPIIGAAPGTGELVLLLSLIVVVVGGLGSVPGAFVAALAVGQVQSLGVVLAPDWAPYLLLTAMAAALLLRRSAGEHAAGPSPEGGTRVGWWPAAVLAGVAVVAPWLVDGFTLYTAARIMALALLAASVAVLTGFAGLPTLGQTAPFAVGAYTAGLLAKSGQLVGPAQLGVAAAAAAGFSLVIGWAVARTRAVVFLMVTLAVGALAATAADQWRGVTGGTDGLIGIPAALPWPGGPPLISDQHLYWYALAVTAAAIGLTVAVLGSPAGVLLRGCRDNEPRMRASGHPVGGYLLAAYTGAGALAGVGGALLVTVQRFVSPSEIGFQVAALVLLAVIVGGASSIWGALSGAALVVAVRDWAATAVPGHGPLLLGALFVAAVYLLPRGMAGLGGDLARVARRAAAARRPVPERAG
jgi:branched-chain amino acid transport system permease protein